MKNSDLDKLKHMRDAMEEALMFSKSKSLEDLNCDRMLALAIIKDLEIMGEAASQISPSLKSKHSHIPWNAIISTRNRLVHGYFNINLEIVWNTIEKDIPLLLRQVKEILKVL